MAGIVWECSHEAISTAASTSFHISQSWSGLLHRKSAALIVCDVNERRASHTQLCLLLIIIIISSCWSACFGAWNSWTVVVDSALIQLHSILVYLQRFIEMRESSGFLIGKKSNEDEIVLNVVFVKFNWCIEFSQIQCK